MTRREWIGAAAAPAFLQTRGDHRSVLLLIGDDHSESPYCGRYQGERVPTPNLDRLAKHGVRFTHGYCTTASCSASRSVLLTGLHNHANGQFGHAHAPHNFHTFEWVHSTPRLAKARGLATGVIGKLHVNPPLVYPWDFEAQGDQRNVYAMAQKAAEFFKQIDGRPFYLHVGFSDPHRAGRGFGNERAYPNVKKKVFDAAGVQAPEFLPDQPEVRQELAEYYQAIDRMDQGIGFFLDVLEKSGRAKDTLVIYGSDNGLPFPGAKASFYETGNRLPLIISAPGMQKRGITNNAMAHWPDILPTAIDWMGVPGPSYPLHGRSLLPIFEQPSPAGRDEIFFSHTFHEINNHYPYRGIRTRRHRYVNVLYPEVPMPLPSDLFDSPTWQGILRRKDAHMGRRATKAVLHHAAEELYDLEKDPLETTNLAEASGHRAVLEELRAKVQKFRRETKDPWLIVDEQRQQASQ